MVMVAPERLLLQVNLFAWFFIVDHSLAINKNVNFYVALFVCLDSFLSFFGSTVFRAFSLTKHKVESQRRFVLLFLFHAARNNAFNIQTSSETVGTEKSFFFRGITATHKAQLEVSFGREVSK